MSLYRRGSVWWLDVYVGEGRRRVRKSTGTNDKIRAKIIEQSVIAVNRNITSRQRAMSIIDNVLPEREHSLALFSAAEYYRTCAQDEGRTMTKYSMNRRVNIVSKFAVWAHKNSRVSYVDEVDATLAFEFSKALGAITAKTRNAYIGELGSAWKLFMRHDKAKFNPWPIVRVPRNRDEETTGRAFSDDEIKRILKAAQKVGKEWPTAIMIGLYTGLRLGDATSLKWSDIDFQKKIICYEPSKTHKHNIIVRIPLHQSLARWLLEHRNESEYITPERKRKAGQTTFYDGDKPFSKILSDAKVKSITGKDKLSFHCFRHTFVSRLAQAGVAQDVRMRLVGHTSATNHAIYTHDDVSSRSAIDLLPEISYTV